MIPEKLLDFINKFSKFSGYKINTQKPIIFLCTKNKRSERAIKETIPCIHPKLLQSCLTLCDPMDFSLPSSSVHGNVQPRILEWVAVPPPGDPPNPGMEPCLLCLLH